MLKNRRGDWVCVGWLVWLVVSISIFIVLVLPFVVPQHLLARYVPQCEWQAQFQKPCAFCGMTTAFYAISRGDVAGAYRLNPLSLYLYAVFTLNTFCAVIALKHTPRFIKSLGAMPRIDNVLS